MSESKSQSLVERLRTEATENNIDGFELSPCWTPELLTEAADQIDRLRAALERIAVDEHSYAGCVGCQDAAKIAHEALAPSPKPMMSADGGEDIPLAPSADPHCEHGVDIQEAMCLACGIGELAHQSPLTVPE